MAENRILDDLYDWFNENRKTIIKSHENENVLITSDKKTLYFSDEKETLAYTQKNNISIGTFLIQSCITEEEDTMMYYNQAILFG